MPRKASTTKIVLGEGHSRAGTKYDAQGRPCGTFANYEGDTVELPTAEAQKYLDRGWATLPEEKE